MHVSVMPITHKQFINETDDISRLSNQCHFNVLFPYGIISGDGLSYSLITLRKTSNELIDSRRPKGRHVVAPQISDFK